MPPFQLDNAAANLNLNDPDNLPPPPPELLQQQYLYGTVPDSRQQAVISNYAPTRGQGFPTYSPGSGQMDLGQPQQVSRWRVFAQTSVLCPRPRHWFGQASLWCIAVGMDWSLGKGPSGTCNDVQCIFTMLRSYIHAHPFVPFPSVP